jgi:hypothetical protein
MSTICGGTARYGPVMYEVWELCLQLIREQQPAPDFVHVNPQLDTFEISTLSEHFLPTRR